MAHILVVDDNDMNLRVLQDMLMVADHHVTTATNANEALHFAHNLALDLILMDVQMPKYSGTAAMQTLKDNPSWISIPIVAVTALAMNGDERWLLEQGFDGYLSKPISLHMLLETVERYTCEYT